MLTTTYIHAIRVDEVERDLAWLGVEHASEVARDGFGVEIDDRSHAQLKVETRDEADGWRFGRRGGWRWSEGRESRRQAGRWKRRWRLGRQ